MLHEYGQDATRVAASQIQHLGHLDALARVSGANDCTLDRLALSFPGGRGLATATEGQLRNLGCSGPQARRIVTAFELARTVGGDRGSCRYVRRPEDAWRYILDRHPEIRDLEVELFVVIALNSRQRPLELFTVGQGTVAQVDVHPREVFCPLVRMRAHATIVAHTHPSGDPTPSDADVHLTHRLVKAAKLLGIPLLDHLVLAGDEFTSLAAVGLLPNARP